MSINLEVGKWYKTRGADGYRSEIQITGEDEFGRFISDNETWNIYKWYKNGRVYTHDTSTLDLVESFEPPRPTEEYIAAIPSDMTIYEGKSYLPELLPPDTQTGPHLSYSYVRCKLVFEGSPDWKRIDVVKSPLDSQS